MTLHCSGDAEAGGSDEGRDSGVYVPGEGLAPGVEPPKEDAIVCFYRQVVRQDTLREPSIELQRVEATLVAAQLNSLRWYTRTLTLRSPDTDKLGLEQPSSKLHKSRSACDAADCGSY